MLSAPRAVTAAAAQIRAGRAARTRSGVGPAANSSLSTELAASRPKVVSTPAARLSATVATVSRG